MAFPQHNLLSKKVYCSSGFVTRSGLTNVMKTVPVIPVLWHQASLERAGVRG